MHVLALYVLKEYVYLLVKDTIKLSKEKKFMNYIVIDT